MSGDQVVVGDIPSEPPGYQPRPGLLAELDWTEAGTPAVHALAGRPGAGKTQLAAAYARARLDAGWRLVAWVSAGNAGTLRAGLATAADALGLPPCGYGPDMADPGQAVRSWLEAGGERCLLVFDGADDPDVLRPYVPAAGTARVLITTTRATEADIPVGVYTPEEALAYLAGRTGLADDAGAAAVAAELGHLPLALAQAAAVIAGQRLDYQAYLKRLHATPPQEDLVPELGQPYSPAAVRSAMLALDAIQAADGTAVCTGVIQLMAVLSAAGVRRELLQTAGQAGLLSPGRRAAATVVDQALAQLAGRSLLTVSLDGRTVAMPRLVRGVVQTGLARRRELTAVCRVTASVLETWAQDLDASRHRRAARDIAEQVTALLAAAGPTGAADDRLARALLRLRFLALYHLIELGDSATQAVAVGEPLAADLERALGPDHPDTLNVRNSLSAAYGAAGRVAEAVTLFERTLVGRQRALGPEHPDTLTSQNNLAVSYQDAGRVAEAILLLKLTLATRERLLGTDHPSTLNSRGNLAAAYLAAGRAAEAIPLLEQTLAGRQWVLGADHPDTVASRTNLDAARRELDRPAEAIPSPLEAPPAQLSPEPPQVEQHWVEQPVAEEPPAEPPPVEEPPERLPAERPSAEQSEADQLPAELLSMDLSSNEQPPAASQEPEASRPEPEVPEPVLEAPEPEPGIPRVVPPVMPGQLAGGRPGRRRVRASSLAAAMLILLVAGGATIILARYHHHSSAAASGSADKGQAVHLANPVQLAAEWVSQQVSRTAIVACDPLMCSALQGKGVPATRLLVLGAHTENPRGAAVVVVTPAVRSQFGSRLDSEYAPSVIAGFGSGPAQVNVRVVAPNGAAAYLAALRQDVAARKAAGTQLLANKRIAAAAAARAQLAAGEVDTRLLIMLPALAATHPIQILAFGDPGPRAGPGVPLSSVDLSGSGEAAGMIDASYLAWLSSFVRAQLTPFTGSMAVLRQGGQPIVYVEFAKPSPLGLLAQGQQA